jgi:lysine N6-hydroxylase
MEYSKLGLEHFTPDHTRYFHRLDEPVRDRLVAAQWQLHKGIDADTVGDIHDELYRRGIHGGWPDARLTPGVHVRTADRADDGRIHLGLEHTEQRTRTTLVTDAVVLATGYRQRPLDRLLGGLAPHILRDDAGRPRIDAHYRLLLDPAVTGDVYVQNAELHTHGVGAPDLGLLAWRSATILNALTGKDAYRLPTRTAFTTFGLTEPRTAAPA